VIHANEQEIFGRVVECQRIRRASVATEVLSSRRHLSTKGGPRTITEGKPDFGPWEQIYYGEFDGRWPKHVLTKIIRE
jgi:hypothetical protein